MDYADCPIEHLVSLVLSGQRTIDEFPAARRATIEKQVKLAEMVALASKVEVAIEVAPIVVEQSGLGEKLPEVYDADEIAVTPIVGEVTIPSDTVEKIKNAGN